MEVNTVNDQNTAVPVLVVITDSTFMSMQSIITVSYFYTNSKAGVGRSITLWWLSAIRKSDAWWCHKDISLFAMLTDIM